MALMWSQDCCQLGVDVPGVFVDPQRGHRSVAVGRRQLHWLRDLFVNLANFTRVLTRGA